MQFHEYRTMRNQAAGLSDRQFADFARKRSSREYRETIITEYTKGENTQGQEGPAFAESRWIEDGRPFYNVWPIAVTLSEAISLDLPCSAARVPFQTLLLRFGRGHERFGFQTALVHYNSSQNIFIVYCFYLKDGVPLSLCLTVSFKDNDVIETLLTGLASHDPEFYSSHGEPSAFVLRLVVFIGLLVHDHDMITPIVLSKDRAKYESTDDPDVKKWLEERAARRAGRGFDVGKKLQEEKDKSPHWRNPHLCLFWTGPDRTKPIIKMRSGAVIQRVSMAEVPTGYLGPETEVEDTLEEDTAQREPIPKAKRFAILKRDGYKCQLCGRLQDDGIKLHVDHRIARAKGGSNEDDNLWTLCEDCNLGKSDADL